MIGILFAAGVGDFVEFIVVVVIIGFSIISQLMSAARQAQAQKKLPGPVTRLPAGQQPVRRRPTPPPGPARPAPGGPQQAGPPPRPKSIEAEIEQFLRQARGEAPPVMPNAPVQPEPVRTLPKTDELVRPGENFTQYVAAHVKEHLGTDRIADRDVGLAQSIELADERIEDHLEKVFDHDVGRLSHLEQIDHEIEQGTDALDQANREQSKNIPVSMQIRDMLRSPDDIRKVFVISEILKRPGF